jgi:glutaconyl-CoA/methylmalonyl-CoA decarboxylase subunit gamma
MKYVVTINNKRYEVEVEKGQATVLSTQEVALGTSDINAPALANKATIENNNVKQGTGKDAVKAPMPGAVLDVKVGVGNKVKEGDTVIILEAMKMENEITAHKDGVIAQILVSKGSYVATNDVLAVIL